MPSAHYPSRMLRCQGWHGYSPEDAGRGAITANVCWRGYGSSHGSSGGGSMSCSQHKMMIWSERRQKDWVQAGSRESVGDLRAWERARVLWPPRSPPPPEGSVITQFLPLNKTVLQDDVAMLWCTTKNTITFSKQWNV